MAKGVLGNDPFQRGAAARQELQKPAEPKQEPEQNDAPRTQAAPPAGEGKERKKAAKAPASPAPSAKAAPKGKTAKGRGAARSARPAAAAQPRKPREPEPVVDDRTAAIGTAASEAGSPAEVAERVSAGPIAEVGSTADTATAGPPPSDVEDLRGAAPAESEPEPARHRSRERVQVAEAAQLEREEHRGVEQTVAVEPFPARIDGSRSLEPSAITHADPNWTERAVGLAHIARDVVTQALRSETFEQLLAAAQGVARAVRTGIGAGSTAEVDPYGKDPYLEQQLMPVADFLYERYWRVSVEGAALLPQGACLLVANHSGAMPFDGPILRQALMRERPDLAEARWLVEDQVFHAPFLGTVFNRLGAIRACPENALRLLAERRPVIVFPEGVQGMGKPFAERYQLKRLGRGGFAKLAVRAQVPLIPVAIVGAEEAFPLLAKLPGRALGLPYLPVTTPPLPSKWSIRFGDPISTSQYAPDAADDPAAVQQLVDASRGAIEGMVSALLKQRKSVFGG